VLVCSQVVCHKPRNSNIIMLPIILQHNDYVIQRNCNKRLSAKVTATLKQPENMTIIYVTF